MACLLVWYLINCYWDIYTSDVRASVGRSETGRILDRISVFDFAYKSFIGYCLFYPCGASWFYAKLSNLPSTPLWRLDVKASIFPFRFFLSCSANEVTANEYVAHDYAKIRNNVFFILTIFAFGKHLVAEIHPKQAKYVSRIQTLQISSQRFYSFLNLFLKRKKPENEKRKSHEDFFVSFHDSLSIGHWNNCEWVFCLLPKE